jgi:hypothetical protein
MLIGTPLSSSTSSGRTDEEVAPSALAWTGLGRAYGTTAVDTRGVAPHWNSPLSRSLASIPRSTSSENDVAASLSLLSLSADARSFHPTFLEGVRATLPSSDDSNRTLSSSVVVDSAPATSDTAVTLTDVSIVASIRPESFEYVPDVGTSSTPDEVRTRERRSQSDAMVSSVVQALGESVSSSKDHWNVPPDR